VNIELRQTLASWVLMCEVIGMAIGAVVGIIVGFITKAYR